MDRKTISKRISELADEMQRCLNIVYSLNMTDIQRYPNNYEILSTEAAVRGEKIACRLRHLVYATTNVRKAVLMEKSAEAQEITIEYKDGIFNVALPALLPKRKRHANSEFLTDPLYFALDRYTNENPIEKFRECVVCFTHVYNENLPDRRIRDYDNIEQKEILDIITTYIMTDDSAKLCDAYNTIELGAKDHTCISVMTKECFPVWLNERLNTMKSI